MNQNETPLKAVILAAGQGKRIATDGSDLPKVMRIAAGKPLLGHVLDALDFIAREDVVIVAGYKRDVVMQAYPQYSYAIQKEQRGTGHAVLSAYEVLGDYAGDVLICCGDMPLLRKETYLALIDAHRNCQNDCTILTGESDVPLSYGRVIRDNMGAFCKIVEDKDCNATQKRITELNGGVYVFRAPILKEILPALSCNNAQNEYYLTDAPSLMQRQGQKVDTCKRDLGMEIIGVNTVDQLKEVEALLQQ